MIEKRQIHINLTKDVYVEFKKQCAEYRLTMQDALEHFICGVVDEREDVFEIFKKLSAKKQEKKINRIARVEERQIFDMILEDNDNEIL